VGTHWRHAANMIELACGSFWVCNPNDKSIDSDASV